MKVVINTCYGGFGLSDMAMEEYCSRKGLNKDEIGSWDIPRDDPILIEIVERMGRDADGDFSQLKVLDIPDGVDWYIDDYDGAEWVAERHRTWE